MSRPAQLGALSARKTDVSQRQESTALIRNQKIGFVFQGFNLLAQTTALENTELPTLYAAINKAERERASEALTMVGPADVPALPSQMSGGQQQRGQQSRVNRPSPFADEFTGNFDSRTRSDYGRFSKNLNEGIRLSRLHEHDIAQFAKRVLNSGMEDLQDDPVLNGKATNPEDPAVTRRLARVA